MSWQDGDALGMRLRIAPGATLSGNPASYPWRDVTSDVAWHEPINLTTGAADEAGETNSQLAWTFRDNNARYDVENAMSDLYGLWDVGTPVELAINLGDGSGWIVKAIEYVAEIGDDYTTAPYRVQRDIVAGGLFRRLGAQRALASTITRNMRSTKAVRYYRLEDGSDSRSAVSDVAGIAPMDQLNSALPSFASRTGVAGSLPVTAFGPGQTLNVNFATYTPIGTSLTWQWLQNVKTLTTHNNLAVMRMTGTKVFYWQVFQDPGFCPRLYCIDGLGNTLYTSTAFGIAAGMVGDGANRPDSHPWWWMSVQLTASGSDVVISYKMCAQWVDGNGVGQSISYTLSSDTVTGVALGSATGFTIAPLGAVEDVAIGHMGLFDSGVNSPLASGTAAVIGWPQSAGTRIAGVANEAGLPNSVTGNPTVQLGAQDSGTVLNLFRAASLADHGILDDSLGKVDYRGLYDLYNLTPVVTLDGQDRSIFHPFRPVRDDQKRKNEVTVSRPGGSSATVDDFTDQAKSGLYTDSPSLSLGSDADLINHAQFGVTIGTQPGKRYPQVTLDLLRAPALARPWLGMRLGDRFQVANPPRGGTRVGVQLQLRGTNEMWLNRRHWTVTCNTVLADPYNVGVFDDPVLGRAEADDGTVTVPAETDIASTSLSVATSAGHPLPIDSATFPADFPFQLMWDGEQIQVDAVVGTSSPQTFTVRRGMNGVRKIHKANSQLKLKTPLRPAF